MKTIYFCITIVLLVSLNAGCSRCPCTASDGLRFDLVSFTTEQSDTIIVRHFLKGSNFTQLLDTLLLDKDDLGFRNDNDTLTAVYALGGAASLASRYDHEIYFPAVNKLTRVSEINEEQVSQPCGLFVTSKVGCVNPIRSYNNDGHVITLTERVDRLYIGK